MFREEQQSTSVQMTIWSTNAVAELQRRWSEGEPAAVIAAALGVTRNAVIGKINRLSGKVDRPKAPRKGRAFTPKNVTKKINPPDRRGKLKATVAPKPFVPPVQTPSGPCGPNPWVRPSWHNRTYRLVDLTNHTCRWPLWDSNAEPRFYCGLAANLEESRPYCAKHAKIAFVPARPR
jgi:GcrA cell cycle regulator